MFEEMDYFGLGSGGYAGGITGGYMGCGTSGYSGASVKKGDNGI